MVETDRKTRNPSASLEMTTAVSAAITPHSALPGGPSADSSRGARASWSHRSRRDVPLSEASTTPHLSTRVLPGMGIAVVAGVAGAASLHLTGAVIALVRFLNHLDRAGEPAPSELRFELWGRGDWG